MLTLSQSVEIVAKAINNIEYNASPRELYEPMQYILSLGGKRIRPALTLMSCNLFSDNVEPAIPAALALEMFHNFTLIHDDIMDNAMVRRGKPVIHAKWNNNVAILSGDGLCIKAYEQLAKCKPQHLPGVLNVFNQTALEVCEGQQYDMNFETTENVSLNEYIKMIGLKTSVLIGACLKIGAITGGANGHDADLLYNFGLNVGLAFQLQDDLLDVFADENEFGKEIGKDIVTNKKTFLLITALEKADHAQRKQLALILNNQKIDKKEKIETVSKIYKQIGIEQLTNAEIEKYFRKAMENLKMVSVNEARKAELLLFLESIKVRKS